jgi:hypothetical protein
MDCVRNYMKRKEVSDEMTADREVMEEKHIMRRPQVNDGEIACKNMSVFILALENVQYIALGYLQF